MKAEAEELDQLQSMGKSIVTGVSFDSCLIWFSTS